MKIEIEKVSNGWVITAPATSMRQTMGGEAEFTEYGWQIKTIARNVPDCLAELSKIMESK